MESQKSPSNPSRHTLTSCRSLKSVLIAAATTARLASLETEVAVLVALRLVLRVALCEVTRLAIVKNLCCRRHPFLVA